MTAFDARTATREQVEKAFAELLDHRRKVSFAWAVDRQIAMIATESPLNDTAPDTPDKADGNKPWFMIDARTASADETEKAFDALVSWNKKHGRRKG